MKNFAIVLLLLIFLTENLYSQSTSFRWYNMDNGLPQNSVKDIVRDKYGFFWLATENGIVEYDGNKFEVYNDFPISNSYFEFFRGNIENDSIVIFSNNETNPIIINKRKAIFFNNKKKLFPYNFQYSGYGIINKNYFFQWCSILCSRLCALFQTFKILFQTTKNSFFAGWQI